MGQLTGQILTDSNRDAVTEDPVTGLPLFPLAIQRAILSAIIFCESKYYWNFKKISPVTILNQTMSVALPNDFANLIQAQAFFGNTFYGAKNGFLNVSFDELQSFYFNPNEVGRPRKYAIQNNTFYIYPLASGDTIFNITYYYKDVTYPTVDGDVNNETTSIWFDPQTIDLVRLKAMQRFYHDTLQAPDLAASYQAAFEEFESNFYEKNNARQTYNLLWI